MSDTLKREMQIPIVGEYDVVVCGSGPAGIGAAVAAARSGLNVLLVERNSSLGGMMTTGLMSDIHTYVNIKGLMGQVLNELANKGWALFSRQWPLWRVPNDPEGSKHYFDELMKTSDVRVLLSTFVVDAVVEDGAVTEAILANKSGVTAVRAKHFIDATGDGDLAAKAGAEFKVGREEDGLCSAPSLLYRIGNIDVDRVLAWMDEHPAPPKKKGLIRINQGDVGVRDAYYGTEKTPRQVCHLGPFTDKIEELWAKDQLTRWQYKTLTMRGLGVSARPFYGEGLVNSTRALDVDPTDAQSVSDAIVECRRQAFYQHSFLKDNIPGFENSYIVDTAEQLGVRESRRVICDYYLTVHDAYPAQIGDDESVPKKFDDVVYRHSGSIEVHNPKGSGTSKIGHKRGEWHEVPLRAYFVKGFTNLLVAGRCFSVDHITLSATRDIGLTMMLGEAVGYTVGLAHKHNVPVREIPVKELQRKIDLPEPDTLPVFRYYEDKD